MNFEYEDELELEADIYSKNSKTPHQVMEDKFYGIYNRDYKRYLASIEWDGLWLKHDTPEEARIKEEQRIERKRQIDLTYKRELASISNIIFQKHIENSEPNCWLFTFRTNDMRGLLNHLNNNGIQARPFWTPMNQLPMYSKLEYYNSNDVTGKIFSECISIPSSSNLSEDDQEIVIGSIKKYFRK